MRKGKLSRMAGVWVCVTNWMDGGDIPGVGQPGRGY